MAIRLPNVFTGLNFQKLSGKAKDAAKWFVQKVKDSIHKSSGSYTRPRLGGMYLYVYDAKYKDKLPFWDAAPLIVVIQWKEGGFDGLNFHYLPLKDRLILLKTLKGLAGGADKRYMLLSYKLLLKMSNTNWSFAYKRYLFSHCRGRFIEIPPSEWELALSLQTANWKKASEATVHSAYHASWR